eukprot:TRINITY_DN43047_c0_g2_i1.p1 TRINITY_DN43047_c0_g2~~TRINITY_DN43047_c0_g2_i1.p1  ORF type:complete len:115 (-),score=18.79 TRINITY_DN43047_c0_g2_i1:1-345(-)
MLSIVASTQQGRLPSTSGGNGVLLRDSLARTFRCTGRWMACLSLLRMWQEQRSELDVVVEGITLDGLEAAFGCTIVTGAGHRASLRLLDSVRNDGLAACAELVDRALDADAGKV